MDLTAIAPPHVRTLDVYQPGKPVEELERELGITGAIKVASNENPLGPSPRALAYGSHYLLSPLAPASFDPTDAVLTHLLAPLPYRLSAQVPSTSWYSMS